MAKKSVVITNEDKSVIVMDEKSIGMQAETISIEGKKNITLVSGCLLYTSYILRRIIHAPKHSLRRCIPNLLPNRIIYPSIPLYSIIFYVRHL